MDDNASPSDVIQTPNQDDDLSVLNHLIEGEDEFDVDLMACGCRYAPVGKLNLGVDDILRLYALNESQKSALIGALIDEGKIDPDRVFEIVDSVAKGVTHEPPQSGPQLTK